MKVNYFDLGLCRGIELNWIVNQIFPSLGIKEYSAYGFEASAPYASALEKSYSSNSNVTICHTAISDKEEKVKLFHSPNAVGHSIFSSKNNVLEEKFEEVDGIRFSHWLKQEGIDLESSFNILKVNIEGAEWHLFRDLVENDLVKHIDIFCGAGHDVEKIGELNEKVDEYYSLLEDNEINIHRFTEWKPAQNANIPKMIVEKMFFKKFPEVEKLGLVKDVKVEPKYQQLWEDIALPIQKKKAATYNLKPAAATECFDALSRRPNYLCNLAELRGVKNIAEVGTAQGLQFFSFAEYIQSSQNDGHVWSCDIIDARNQKYADKYKECATFCPGNSEALATKLEEENVKIDMFYVDGGHEYEDLVRDVYYLKKVQSENPIWVFDDFDERFGCYRAIQAIMRINKNCFSYRVGNAASGNPNHQVIMFGKL